MKTTNKYQDEFPKADWEIERKVGNTSLPYKEWVKKSVEAARSWGLLDEDYEEGAEEDEES